MKRKRGKPTRGEMEIPRSSASAVISTKIEKVLRQQEGASDITEFSIQAVYHLRIQPLNQYYAAVLFEDSRYSDPPHRICSRVSNIWQHRQEIALLTAVRFLRRPITHHF